MRAVNEKLDIISLTDHDTITGLAEAASLADKHKIKFIPGVEISCSWRTTTLHVVALGIERRSDKLQKLLQQTQNSRQERARAIGQKLEMAGITNAYNKARAMSRNGLITRTHYAKLLLKESRAASLKHSFKKYLSSGKPGFVKGNWAKLQGVISTVHGAGGLAIIAHPLRYKMSNTKLNTLLSDFKNHGGDGIEAVNAGNNPDSTKYLSGLCSEYELYASCGSDFHAPGGFIELGKMPPIPGSCRPIWNEL